MTENTVTLPQKLNISKKRQKGVLRFYPKSAVMLAIILFLCYAEYRYSTSYIDEVSALIALVAIFLSAPKLTRRDVFSFLFIGLAVVMGVLGNLIYGLVPSWFSVGVDVLSQLKMPLAFFSVKYALNAKEKQATIEMLLPIAKVYLVINALLAVASQVLPLPFTGTVRYGIKSYMFVFGFTQQYATVTFLMFGAIICSKQLTEKTRNRYIAFGVIAAIATLKSFSLVFVSVYLVLFFFFKRRRKINLPIIVLMIGVGLFIGSYQIKTYLMDEDSPRRLFFHYAAVDANEHFPLGSGFATFGSSEAQKNYSPLYYQYGFNTRWGMSPDMRSFLVDTYWPTVIGQLGWFGAVMFVFIYVRIFSGFSTSVENNDRKAYLYAFFIQYMVHAIGAAILQSSAGFLGFLAMSLFTTFDFKEENKPLKTSFHIRL